MTMDFTKKLDKMLASMGIIDDIEWNNIEFMNVATFVFTVCTFLISVKLCMM